MLIIVNPYATTVSDRLRHLVVYALQGRFEVDAVDTEARGHATELCREAAHEGYDVVVAFGGDGTVNEAANGLLGSSTPLSCLPGGSANVFGKMLGIPGELVDATEHLLAHGRRLAPAQGRPRASSTAAASRSPRASASTRACVVQRVDANPRLKARLGAYYFTWVALRTFAAPLPGQPAAAWTCRPSGQTLAGRHRDRAERLAVHLLPQPPDRDRRWRRRSTPARSCGCVLRRATPLSMPSIAWRAFSRDARVSRHRQVTGLAELTELTVRATDGARCRCRSTATTSARRPGALLDPAGRAAAWRRRSRGVPEARLDLPGALAVVA